MFDRCGECAKKHLRAALAYASSRFPNPAGPENADIPVHVASPTAFASEAWVLLSESGSYPEHFDLAVGAVVRAEEASFAGGTWDTVGRNVRNIRLAASGPVSLMCNLEAAGLVDPMVGHMMEASREGRFAIPPVIDAKAVIDNFDGLVKAAETPTPGKGKEGDEAMACAKKAACKGSKATKAACKGGSCKKGGKKGCK